MEKQAEEIASWGKNVNVKIPITNTKKVPTTELIRKLSAKGITCNVTAIFTISQMQDVVEVLDKTTPAILSVFAGRIADTGIDPEKIIKDSIILAKSKPKSEILWASTRGKFKYISSRKNRLSHHKKSHDLLKKISNIGKNLEEFSLETVHGFYTDALSAGYKIKLKNEI